MLSANDNCHRHGPCCLPATSCLVPLGSPDTGSEGSDDDSSSGAPDKFEVESDPIYLNDEFAVPLSAPKTWAAVTDFWRRAFVAGSNRS